MTNTNTTEAARTLRTAIKAAGIPARAVSVRARSFSMGSAIDVEIRGLDVSFSAVEALANAAENIRRDASGEILGGGNRYVSVSVDGEAIEAEARKLEASGDLMWRGREIFADAGVFFVAGSTQRHLTIESAIRAIYCAA